MIVMLKDMLIHEPTTDASFLCPLPALKRKSI